MIINKKTSVTFVLLSAIMFGAVASLPPDHDEKFQNLKVLPKKISHQQLHAVMDGWNRALGVRCNFCHARNEATNKIDFASDAKPEKSMAREMFEMTGKINNKFFKAGKDSLGMIMESSVNCNTCHHGTAHPEVHNQAEGMKPGGPGINGPGQEPGGPPPEKKPM